MKISKMIYMCIAIIIAVLLLYKFLGNNQISTVQTQQSQPKATLSTQTSEGLVIVEATPKTVAKGTQAVFDLKFITHSGDINYDLVKTATLRDDAGKSYKPLRWKGSMGGHHVEGTLTFPELNTSVKKVTLTVPNIDSQDRVFTWEIEK